MHPDSQTLINGTGPIVFALILLGLHRHNLTLQIAGYCIALVVLSAAFSVDYFAADPEALE